MYIHNFGGNDLNYDIILFSGTRWIMLKVSKLNFPPLENFANLFPTFHLDKDGVNILELPDYISDPTVGSSLVGLTWYRSSPGQNYIPTLDRANAKCICAA